MDIKIKCEHAILCHGCLSEDRTIYRISGDIREMFYGLRNDTRNRNRLELILCWECVAFLKKLKMFKARITTAQSLLMQYIKSYCKHDPIPKLRSLSSLNKLHINTFDYEFEEEEKPVFPEFRDQDEKNGTPIEYVKTELEDVHQNENLPAEELLTDMEVVYDDGVKEKNSDCIEEEYNSSNENNSDYEPVLKFEVEESKDKPSSPKKLKTKQSPPWLRVRSAYLKYATVTVRKDIWDRTYLQFAKLVSLDKNEYEKVLKRDESRYGYLKMQFKCDECRVGYLKELDLQRHKSLCHSNETIFPFKCADCPMMVTSLEQQEQHWAVTHSEHYKCTICSEVHQSAVEIKKHLFMQHRRNYTCNKCDFECGSIIEFREHYQLTHEKLICDYCNEKCMKKQTLISHIQLCHVPAYCDICKRSYTNLKYYKIHKEAMHPELCGVETPKELPYCVECNKQFRSAHKYQAHLRTASIHNKDKLAKAPCPECGKMLIKTHIKTHIRFIHLKITKHYCAQCDKYYTSATRLREHINSFHKKIPRPKNIMCDICGKGFALKAVFANHRRTHTGERPYKCPYCPAAFVQRSAMKTHEKAKHKNVDRSSQPTEPSEGSTKTSGAPSTDRTVQRPHQDLQGPVKRPGRARAPPTSAASRYTC